MATSRNQADDAAHVEPSIGASDANNGGGSGAGIPNAETAMRVGDPAHEANVAADHQKLFPGIKPKPDAGQPPPTGA